LFVSNFTGEITEILDDTTDPVLPAGLNWPLDLAVDADGSLYIADGTYFYLLRPDHTLQTVGMLFTPGYPGFLRGLVPSGPGEFVVTTSGGQVSRYRPADGESEVLADGFDQLYGVDLGPNGTIACAELGTSRVVTIHGGRVEVIASGLLDPIGVAAAPDGGWLVSEARAGRVVELTGSGVRTVAAEFDCPQGILVARQRLYVVDAGAKALVAVDLADGSRHTIASGLPLGAAPSVVPKPLKGMPPFSGPQGPFAGIATGPDGTLYVSADADGSVLAFRPEARDG
jgi:DNA-binding beta-propeller fold protein YncE